MADRIDIFGEGEGVAEPEVPTFLGVEQEKLTKPQYSGEFVDFFSQYYGMEALDGLGDTGIGIEEPETITDLTKPTDILDGDKGKDDTASSGFKGEVFSGQSINDLKYSDYNSDHIAQYGSYSGYLSATGTLSDRLPTIGNITEPLVTGNFSEIDFAQAIAGEYQGVKVGIQDLPSDISSFASNFVKGELTADQSSTLAALAVGASSSLMGTTLASLIGGETVLNAFGNPSLRPAGFPGLVADAVHSIQYADRTINAAARAANAELEATVGSSMGYTDFGEAGRSLSSLGPTGFEMVFSNGFGITRRKGSSTYTGNFQGMSYQEIKAMDALSHGYIPKGYNNVSETGTTIANAGWRSIGYTGVNGENLSGQIGAGGYYKQDGSYMSANGIDGARYGTTASVSGFAAKNGLSYNEAQQAITGTRNGTYKNLDDAVATIKSESSKGDTSSTPSTSKTPGKPSDPAAQVGPDQPPGGAPEGTGVGGGGGPASEPGGYTGSGSGAGSGSTAGSKQGGPGSFAEGGKIGYAFGTPPPGVQAQPSGFIDAPPSQVAEGQKVADNRDMEVKKGTYILNAAAVEFAGEQDIRKMIMDAQKEAVRRGLSTEDFERHSDLIDIAVSSGEVTIAPHLVKIIGEDRLEKINKRGLRKTEERIAQNGQQPVGAAGGGFLYHAGGGVHSHAKAAQSSESSEREKFYKEMDELRKRQDEQARRQSQTPSLNTRGEKLRYKQGIEFGDVEVYADILGKTNFNSLIQAAARDTRTLSDYVTTLKKDEEVASFIGKPLGQYSRSAYSEDILNVGPYESGITMKNPSFFLNPDTSNVKGYTAVLAHELMHKGADTLANDPNFKPSEALVKMQQKYSEIPSITDKGGSKAAGQRVTQGDAEHRYIAAVIGQAYLKRDMESLTGTMQKLKKEGIKITDYEAKFTTKKDGTVDYDLVAFYRAVDKKDISLERKFAVRNEIRRVYSLYLTDDNRNQFIDENKSMFEEDYGVPMNLDSIEDIPYSALLKSYASINRIMAEDYMTQLFEGAVANKPVDIPRMEKQPTPEINLPPEQKYERGFLEKMLGITPAY